MKRFIYSSKAIYTYDEIDHEMKNIIKKLSVEEKLDFIRNHHRGS